MRTETISGYLDRLAAGDGDTGGSTGTSAAPLHAAHAAALLAAAARAGTGAGAGTDVGAGTDSGSGGEAGTGPGAGSGTGERAGAEEARGKLTARITKAADGLREMALKLADDDSSAAGAAAIGGNTGPGAPGSAPAVTPLAAARARGAVIMIAEAAVELAGKLLPVAARPALPDLTAAVGTARAAACSARAGVEFHLGSVTDPAAREELAELTAGVDALAERADRIAAAVRERLTA